ncbi:hypothetical protein B0H10DRAFT_2199901 [Mycena sp. CBHHK59/15]|nr:hypothetical protein B0H10DRAFT_2199901 [Mycena sp. CBHHK59/15]
MYNQRTMVVANAEIPLEALSGAEGGTPTPSGSALAWEEQLSQQLSQLSSDLAHLRQWSLHTSHESELARFRQWSFYSQTLAPRPFLSDKSHDFWDLEIIDQARDMSDFRAGLRAAPTEDALIRYPSGEGYQGREDIDNPLAEANYTSRESELARFRQWSFYSQTLGPSPLLPDKSHAFWDLEIIHQGRGMSDFRAGLRAAPKDDAMSRYPPGEGYHDREDVDNPLSEALSDARDANSTTRESELARFRQRSLYSQTPSPSPPLAHKSHDFWDLETIDQALDMSDFRAGLCSAPTEDALIRFPRPEGYHHTEDIGNPLAEAHDRTSRLRESLSSLTTDSLATQEISSGSFGSSTFGGSCSIGIAQQAFSGALLREFKRVPSQFQPQSSSTPKRLNNPASGSMSMEASIPALLNNNFQGEYRKAASSGCGPIPMNLVFRPPTTAFQRGCSRHLGDITNSQAHDVGPAQSWKEHPKLPPF